MMSADEHRHQIRVAAEEPIFQQLQAKYGETYKEWWNNPLTQFPKESPNKVLLVERRPHPNILFVLQNAMYFCRDFSLTIVCSDESEGYVRELLGHHVETTEILPLFKGIGSRDQGRNEYNALFMDKNFWKLLKAEYVLSIQTDSYLLNYMDEAMWSYDYIACPWVWDKELVGGGGLTWRKVACCIEICERFTDNSSNEINFTKKKVKELDESLENGEDVFFAQACKALSKKIPSYPESTSYFVESIFHESPIGVHQWWTYVFPAPNIPEKQKAYLFNLYTTIHV